VGEGGGGGGGRENRKARMAGPKVENWETFPSDCKEKLLKDSSKSGKLNTRLKALEE